MMNFFLNINVLLQIFVIIPITIVTAEGTYFSVRFHKGYIEATMSEDRLNNLAILNIHKNLPIDQIDVNNEVKNIF